VSQRSHKEDQLQANKTVARRILEEVIDGKDLDLADELIAEDVHDHCATPGSTPGREGWKEWVRGIHASYPDWRHTIEDIIAEGDKVVVRQTAMGTHRGTFHGIEPTGKLVRERGIDVMRIRDGKMVEHWGEYDWFGLFTQLGAITPPGEDGNGK
jgi:steroid delta-isomerase-like uncharacterized protein